MLDRDGVFEVRTSNQGEHAGNGVFCVEDVKTGTILPYYAVSFKESRASKDMERTYVIGGDYNNSKGNPQTSMTYSVDGNPFIEPILSLSEYKKLGCQINEASKGSKVNSIFTLNPFLHKGSFKESFTKQEPIVAALIVVIEDLSAGTELLTMYGSDYSDREYDVCKMKRKEHDRLVEIAYSFTDALFEKKQSESPTLDQSDKEPDEKKNPGEPIGTHCLYTKNTEWSITA